MLDRESRVLEFGHVLERLAAQARSAPGKALCQALRPHTNYAQVAHAQEETAQAEAIYYKLGYHPVPEFQDILPLLARAQVGSILSAGDLLTVGDALACARQVKALLRREEEDETPNGVRDMGAALYENRDLEEDIRRCILSPEEISDFASPELAKIRRQIRSGGERVTQKLNSYLHNPQLQKYLQEPIITIRADRYVLPVRQEYRSQVPGLIHDQSSSGATLFIEPMAVVEINNEIRQLRGQERGEIERILGEFSARTAGSSEALRQNQQILTELDFIFAKAALSREMRGVAPRLNQKGILNIKKGRHPMIDREKVVPLDIHLGREFTTLIITGPNTGGKTVALKTCGLFALMTQAGLHIPAELGSEMPVFEAIYADIGDEQSIAQSLSTFSSHMTHIVEILESAGKDCLVLLDELGAGTDPTEGAALAMAILQTLQNRGALTMATTHYSELKAYALTQPGMENGSVEFNVETLSPTYRLSIGVPGRSNAFEISRRLGLTGDIIEKAREFLSAEDIRFEDVISSAEENRLMAEKERQVAQQARQEAQQARLQAQQLERELAAQREKMLAKAREQARSIITRAQAQAEEAVRELKRVKNAQDQAERDKVIAQQRSRLRGELGKVLETVGGPVAGSGQPPKDLKPGETVKVLDLDTRGTVLTRPDAKGEVQLQVGIMKLSSPISNLRRVEVQQTAQPAKRGGGKSVKLNNARSVNLELDVRGQNVEEALLEVEKFLDNALISGLSEVNIIHGKGTGVLRSGIQSHLRHHPHVAEFRLGRYGEGEGGVTVVKLK